jgi:crotonobetainyl-CoA:carnitine CoA-transferase CaiB-like acyl-CoA transferase
VPHRGPLAGLRILDFTRVVSGPFCTMLLGDLGADVVKLEEPGHGDESRQLAPPFVGTESALFLAVNRNKRSVAVDLKDAAVRRRIRALAPSFDVLVENFRPGVMDRLGLGWPRLRRMNPRLIYCSISAFDADSRYRDRPGYDVMISGLCGLMSVTGEPDGPPIRPGVNVVDMTSGLTAAVAILAALRARERTRRGQHVGISLMGAALAMMGQAMTITLNTGQTPGRRRVDDLVAQIVPYGTYRTADGRYVNIAVPNQKLWLAFCAAIGRPDLADDPRFASNVERVKHRDAMRETLRGHFRTEPRDAWIDRLQAAGVPAGAVRDMSEVLKDPYAAESRMVVEVDHPTSGPVALPGIPIRFSATPGAVRRPPPVLGQHGAGADGLAAVAAELAGPRRRARPRKGR